MSALIPLALFLILLSYGVRKFSTRVSHNIPYAGGESFISRLKVPVEYGRDPVGFLNKQRAKLGDVFCVDLFLLKIVYFLGAGGNKIVFRAHEDQLSFWESVKWTTWPGVAFGLDVPGWASRSVQMTKFGLIKRERIENYAADTAHLADEFFDKWSQQESVPLFKSISDLTFAHLFTMILGEDFYKRHGEELIPVIEQFMLDVPHPLLRLLPWSMWHLTTPGSRLLKNHGRLVDLFDIECRDIFANPEKHRGRSDYLYFVCCENGPEFSCVYGEHIVGMIFAGHGNVPMTIPWMYLHARRTPGALGRWHEEALLGPDEKKPFLEACLRETGRLYTNTITLRRTKSTVTVAGHTLPPGTMVACSPAATQRDPEVFKDPNVWRPERFLAEGAYADWFQKMQFVQFGYGQHACTGEKIARVIIFDNVVKTWMEKYNVEVVGGLREGVIGVDGVGVEATWTEHNFGTPYVRGNDVRVRVSKLGAAA